ncbi:Uncharacterised protein [Bordetella pertussis]|nr:Uncharacterised protein [Bordetella pertussis]
MVGALGVQVRHQAGVVIRGGVVAQAGGLSQRRGGAVGADEQLGAQALAAIGLDLAGTPADAALGDPGDAEHLHRLHQHPFDLAGFDDPGQLRLRRLPGVQAYQAVAVAMDFHGLHRRQAGRRHGVPHAQPGQELLAGGRNRVDARMIAIGLGRRHRRARRQHRHPLPAARQRQGAGQADDAGAANHDLGFHRADGSPACLGHSSHIWPRCFMRPACWPASSP